MSHKPGDELLTSTASWQHYLDEINKPHDEELEEEQMNDVVGGAADYFRKPPKQDD
ncbi:MAG: hypothetical protein AB7K24_00640 [Gemmataceae bacterium]